MQVDAIPVEHLFTMTAHTADHAPAVIRGAPGGTRLVVTAMRGTFEGPKLRGTLAEVAGGDWVTVRADGSMKVDVRLVLRTHDGADILMTYSGIATRDGDGIMTVRTAPLFETGDERYSWLNQLQAVARGRVGEGAVTYEVFALV
jgi:hypothetical protein